MTPLLCTGREHLLTSSRVKYCINLIPGLFLLSHLIPGLFLLSHLIPG